MDNNSVSFKIYLFTNDCDQPEVRRFGLAANFAGSYRALKDRITVAFTGLADKQFTLSWKDEEDDEVSVSSDDELLIALASMKTDVKKFYLRVQPPVSGSPENGGNILHLGVYCDGCESSIAGYRYKCLTCRDYDLCSTCEHAGLHPGHMMLRIPNPSFVENMNIRKMLHFMRSFVPDMRHHDGEDIHPCKKRRKHEKRRSCPMAEGMNPHHAPYGYLDWGFRALQNLLDPLGATVEIQVPGHHEDKKNKEKKEDKKEDKKEEKQNKETPESTPTPPKKDSARNSDPEVISETLKQKINEITKILANQSMGKDSEDDGWVAFEELKKDIEEPRPSTSDEGVSKASAPPADKTSPQTNLYPNLVPQQGPASERVRESLEKMLSMGFTNEGNWLRRLLEAKDGSIDRALEALSVDKSASK